MPLVKKIAKCNQFSKMRNDFVPEITEQDKCRVSGGIYNYYLRKKKIK